MNIRRSCAALLLALTCASASAAPKPGEPAPAFSAVDSRGKTVTLADYRGRHVVLEWTNADCPFVRKHYGSGNMQALQKQATGRDVVWLSVISSAPGKEGHVDGTRADQLTRERGALPTAVLLDASGEVGRRYGAKTTPHLFLVDPKGTLLYMGAVDSIASADVADVARAEPYFRQALEEALAGKTVTRAVTRPYGCAVKY